VTSYTELARDAESTSRWNMLHPTERPRQAFLEKQLAGVKGPFIAASDYVRALAEQIGPWVPDLFVLGTDGFGRSEARKELRRHFEVDAECITLATLYQLAQAGQFDRNRLGAAVGELGINPEKANPLTA
jgi:pyruvate dehydrogenase E1 component